MKEIQAVVLPESFWESMCSDRKMLINAANQAMVALQETHYAMISAGLLDQERLNKNFTAHEELRAAIAKARGER